MTRYPIASHCVGEGMWVAHSAAAPGVEGRGTTQASAEAQLATLLMLGEVARRAVPQAPGTS